MIVCVTITAYYYHSQNNVNYGPLYTVLNNHIYYTQQREETAVIVYLREAYKHRSTERLSGPKYNQLLFKEMQLPGRLL